MHDAHDTRRDDAARAVRDALPAPDPQATDRIAARIASGMQPQARSSASSGRGPRRRRMGALRPALALGAVATAAAVALLAPSQDRDGRGVGPELAAAETLQAAGQEALADDWAPLAAGEYHYTSNSWVNPLSRTRMTEHTWLAADGAQVREVRESQLLPEGTVFWTTAERCASRPRPGMPGPMPGNGPTIPAGSEFPSCWASQGALRTAFGEVVDAPPAGALVEGIDVMPARVDGELRWGSTVTEEPGPPPGITAELDAALRAGTAPVAEAFPPITREAPMRVPRATTWVQVRASEYRVFRGELGADAATMLGDLDWRAVHGSADRVPSGVDELYRVLDERARRAAAERANPNVVPFATFTDRPVDAFIAMATNLLASAPLAPEQRRAVLDALARLAAAEDARIERGAPLPDGGGSGIRIDFVQPTLARAEGDADLPGWTTSLYLDDETLELRAVASGVEGQEPYVTTWERSRRVSTTELPPVE